MKKSFIMYIDSLSVLNELSIEEVGKLFLAIKDYQESGKTPEDKLIKIIFTQFKNQFDRDKEKYLKTCKARADAGRKGGLAKASKPKQKLAKASKSKQDLANLADNDNDNDNDSDSEINNTIMSAFEFWWKVYPVSRRKNKNGCLEKFKRKCKKFNVDQIERLTNKIVYDIKKRVATTEVKYIPMTETYLNQERWNDGE